MFSPSVVKHPDYKTNRLQLLFVGLELAVLWYSNMICDIPLLQMRFITISVGFLYALSFSKFCPH